MIPFNRGKYAHATCNRPLLRLRLRLRLRLMLYRVEDLNGPPLLSFSHSRYELHFFALSSESGSQRSDSIFTSIFSTVNAVIITCYGIYFVLMNLTPMLTMSLVLSTLYHSNGDFSRHAM